MGERGGCNIASLVGSGCFASLRSLGWLLSLCLLDSNSEAHLSPPLEDRHVVEERKENRANFRKEQKAV